MRLIVCFILCVNTSSIYTMHEADWGGWIMVFFYCLFQIEFYTRFNAFSKTFKYIMNKLQFSKMLKISKIEPSQMQALKALLSGYLLDFQFILIPRLMILFYFNHSIDSHHGDFIKDCALSLSDRFPKNICQLYCILMLNFALPIFLFIWMHRKKQILFEFRFEDYNIIQRSYLIFLFHAFFEFIFNDFLANILN